MGPILSLAKRLRDEADHLARFVRQDAFNLPDALRLTLSQCIKDLRLESDIHARRNRATNSEEVEVHPH